MKLFNVLPLLFFGLIHPETQAQKSKNSFSNDQLTGLEISFEGFFQDTISELAYSLNANFRILKEKDSFYGTSSTNLYHGTKKVPTWKTLLSKDQLSEIKKFASTLSKAPIETTIFGYHNSFYKAKFNNQEWYVKPDRDLFGDFSSDTSLHAPDLRFYQSIFAEQIQIFFKNQKIHIAEVNKHLKQKWYYTPDSFANLKKDSFLKFQSSPDKNNTQYWEIHKQFEFSQSSGPIRETSPIARVDYNIQEGLTTHMYLSIYATDLIARMDKARGFPTHTSFYIIRLNEKEMTLQIIH